jgi:hypothetical protein
MLATLGHEPTTRKDLTRKNLEEVNYRYYPYLTAIYTTEEQCREFTAREKISEPLMDYLCSAYIDTDKMNYEQYLKHIADIDNDAPGTEINQITDPLSWQSFSELLGLYIKSYEYSGLDSNLAYKVSELFWRLCETKNIEMEFGIKML